VIRFDNLTDVVSAFIEDTKTAEYRPAPSDCHIMIERDAAGSVVGVELCGASRITRARWEHHPDRNIVPSDLLVELDRWLAMRWADARR
jgi:uncharacterized protein YuzE